MFLSCFLLLIFILLAESFFFRNHFMQELSKDPTKKFSLNYFSVPTISHIPIFFSLLLAYYVQPFILILRKELLAPSQERLSKVASYSLTLESLLYIAFGTILYFCLGNENMVDLIILRKPYEGKNFVTEWIFVGVIGCFFAMSCIGLP